MLKIAELYKDNEEVSLNSYLQKKNVADIEEFLNPTGKYIDSFHQYYNMDKAVQEVKYAMLLENSHIVIVQDGDVDGICSTAILYMYLHELKKDVKITILLHESKERGLEDEKIMNRIREEKPTLVIVPDAGSNNVKESEELDDLGIGLVVLDHHDIKTPITKGTLVNNQSEKNNNVQPYGSGALVAHKFLQALDAEFDLNWSGKFIDLVALSLVSDSMKMCSMENRTYYYYGIETRGKVNNEFLGALIDKFIGGNSYTQRDLAFRIIPKLNAVCRSTDQKSKQEVLLGIITEGNEENAIEICAEAHKHQIETVSSIIDYASETLEKAKDNNLIFYADDIIPRSYSGLVCGKTMSLCDGKPSIVGSIKDGVFIGSLRSPIPLREDLDNNELVEWASGHPNSCGVCIKEENISKLIDYYNSVEMDYTPRIDVLKSYPIKNLPNRLYSEFEPYNTLWGKDIEEPTFHLNKIVINPTTDIKILGNNKRTIKIICGNVDLLLFNCRKEDKVNLGLGYYDDSDTFVEHRLNQKIEIECVGTLNINRWNGRAYNQVIIKEMEINQTPAEPTIDDIF